MLLKIEKIMSHQNQKKILYKTKKSKLKLFIEGGTGAAGSSPGDNGQIGGTGGLGGTGGVSGISIQVKYYYYYNNMKIISTKLINIRIMV